MSGLSESALGIKGPMIGVGVGDSTVPSAKVKDSDAALVGVCV